MSKKKRKRISTFDFFWREWGDKDPPTVDDFEQWLIKNKFMIIKIQKKIELWKR